MEGQNKSFKKYFELPKSSTNFFPLKFHNLSKIYCALKIFIPANRNNIRKLFINAHNKFTVFYVYHTLY